MRHFLLLVVSLLIISCSHYDESYSFQPYEADQADPAVPGDRYNDITENPFVLTSEEATSTFSIDADGGSYANVRRFLEQDNQLPPKGAVRTEELINYFDLNYPQPTGEHPIALNGEVSGCPWAPDHRLVRIGIQGKDLPAGAAPTTNFVFLVDVSGSMSSRDKLGLLKTGMHRFVEEMGANDRLSIVTYAGSTRVHLPSTPGSEADAIRRSIDDLSAGGGTNGGDGILLAYEQAEAGFRAEGNNRILIGTDGDFNVGLTGYDELLELIEQKRETGIFLTVLGLGRGNYNEALLEQLANHGNGTYEYLDKVEQLEKVFLHERGKFFTIAKDVKVQVTFEPQLVSAYRLIGYENRVLNNEDFEDDTEDAGEIGAGQNVTALYEIIPAAEPAPAGRSLPSFNIDFRYKQPTATTSVPLGLDVVDEGNTFGQSSDYMRFTAATAGFGLLLLDSEYKGSTTYAEVRRWLSTVELADEFGYRGELTRLVDLASEL